MKFWSAEQVGIGVWIDDYVVFKMTKFTYIKAILEQKEDVNVRSVRIGVLNQLSPIGLDVVHVDGLRS